MILYRHYFYKQFLNHSTRATIRFISRGGANVLEGAGLTPYRTTQSRVPFEHSVQVAQLLYIEQYIVERIRPGR